MQELGALQLDVRPRGTGLVPRTDARAKISKRRLEVGTC